jgi:signal transduction histidine kinase
MRDVVAVDPAEFDPVPSPPPVTIETVLCGGRLIPLSGGGVVLPPGSKELEVQYTGFDDAKPEQLRFRHRLHKGGDWEYAEGSRVVRYASLGPGAYEFELSAAKADGHWLEPGALLAITVQPYFWQTTTFRAGVVVGLFAAGVGIVAVVMRRKDRLHRAELAHQRALADAEREIAVQRDELAHLSRVTVLGELSGSIAHELNQPLSAIMSNAQAALHFLDQPATGLNDVREILKDIVDADRRASDVITRLRLLFTKGKVVYTPLPPAEVIREVQRLLRCDLLKHGVTVRELIADDLPAVRGDRVQLQQVLINLVRNACEAMSAVRPGDRRLTVRAERKPDGEGLLVSVTDNGSGITPEGMEQVFKPFFSTKPEGMGLGLAVCQTIVSAHGGRLWAEHADGGGTRFFLALPAADADGNTPSEPHLR